MGEGVDREQSAAWAEEVRSPRGFEEGQLLEDDDFAHERERVAYERRGQAEWRISRDDAATARRRCLGEEITNEVQRKIALYDVGANDRNAAVAHWADHCAISGAWLPNCPAGQVNDIEQRVGCPLWR